MTYLHPFRFVVPDRETPWSVSIDEINANQYNQSRLWRIVEKLPTPLGDEWPMLVCYDGALAIPRRSAFDRKEDAVEFFNSTLCKFWLGGLLCDAVDTRDVVWGTTDQSSHLWPVDPGESRVSNLHFELRARVAGPMNTIKLHEPEQLSLSSLRKAYLVGHSIVSSIPSLSPKFLLLGSTDLRNRDWSSALSNIWIVIEQLTDHLWKSAFLTSSDLHPETEIAARKRALKEDNRTWSTTVKQELLYQAGIISEEALVEIFPARQARNALVHGGREVPADAALSACEGALRLLKLCTETSFEVEPRLYRPRDDELRRGKPMLKEPRFDDWTKLGSVD